jgi:glutaminyl-peptide cyclotransferase
MQKIIAFILLVSIITSCKEEAKNPAAFDFVENLATKWTQVVSIKMNVPTEGIQKVELYINDELLQTWKKPTQELSFPFDAATFGIGAHKARLTTTFEDETIHNDDRIIRVLSDIKPEIWFAHVKNTFPHLTTSFTQGLEFSEGLLYEGTGQRGQSMVAQVDLNSGKTILFNKLDNNFFGEGITIFGDYIYQITWQEQRCFRYNKNTLVLDKDFNYTGEGWGLCNDGKSIIMSDGSERIYFRNPETFAFERMIEVYSHLGPISKLNELEFIDGYIYANVWMSNRIVVIEPETGRVIAEIDGTEVEQTGRKYADVMNGIAYNKENEKLYLTGKNWDGLYEVTIEKPIFKE